jgi:hypothetical protein
MASEGNARRIEVRAEARRRGRRRGRPTLTTLRIAELSRIFCHRYAPTEATPRERERWTLPDDDAGRDDAALVLFHLVRLAGDPAARATAWAETRAPWLQDGELVDAIETALRRRRGYKADVLAIKLGLTADEREKLQVRTIGAADLNKRQRETRRKALRRDRARQRRRDRGAVSRDTYLKKCAEKAKPWLSEGVAERTWYRRQAKKRRDSGAPAIKSVAGSA